MSRDECAHAALTASQDGSRSLDLSVPSSLPTPTARTLTTCRAVEGRQSAARGPARRSRGTLGESRRGPSPTGSLESSVRRPGMRTEPGADASYVVPRSARLSPSRRAPASPASPGWRSLVTRRTRGILRRGAAAYRDEGDITGMVSLGPRQPRVPRRLRGTADEWLFYDVHSLVNAGRDRACCAV